jgi:hypothetical protein
LSKIRVVSILFSALALSALFAQQASSQQQTASSRKASSVTVIGNPALPDDFKLVMLIKTTIIAVNQANLTGNYSVLRDLGTPAFQLSNNPSKLSDIFASLRQRNLDLSPILYFDPKLLKEPQLQENGVLRMTGFLPTAPEQINFDLAFEMFDGHWRLDGIALGASKPSAAKTSSNQTAPANAKTQ